MGGGLGLIFLVNGEGSGSILFKWLWQKPRKLAGWWDKEQHGDYSAERIKANEPFKPWNRDDSWLPATSAGLQRTTASGLVGPSAKFQKYPGLWYHYFCLLTSVSHSQLRKSEFPHFLNSRTRFTFSKCNWKKNARFFFFSLFNLLGLKTNKRQSKTKIFEYYFANYFYSDMELYKSWLFFFFFKEFLLSFV